MYSKFRDIEWEVIFFRFIWVRRGFEREVECIEIYGKEDERYDKELSGKLRR